MHGDAAMSGRLTVERLAGPEDLANIACEWHLLDGQTAPRLPFTSPAYVVRWWKHFARRRQMLFHDEFFCHIVRDGDGRLVAVAPLMRTSTPGLGPPIMRVVQFFGADAALTEIRGLICRPEDQAAVVEALAEHLLARRGEWDVFRWSGLREAAGTYRGARRMRSLFAPKGDLPDYVLDLRGSWEDMRDGLSLNMRKNLRKAYQSLDRDGVAFSLRVTEQPNGVAAALDRFFALHAARAEAADMIFHPNKFARSHVRAFFADYLQEAAKRGELRIFELEIGGVMVASRIGLVLGTELYMHLAGYDPAWKGYSAMTVLMAEIIKWSIACRLEQVNLSAGHDQSKLSWKPREVLFRDAVQVSPTWRARGALGVFHAYQALHRARFKAIVRGRRLADPTVKAPQPVEDAPETGQSAAPRRPASVAGPAGGSRVQGVPS